MVRNATEFVNPVRYLAQKTPTFRPRSRTSRRSGPGGPNTRLPVENPPGGHVGERTAKAGVGQVFPLSHSGGPRNRS